MKQLSTPELEALLDDLESDRVERKESSKGNAMKKIGQAICAFANDLPNYQLPGVLFIGAKDNGSPSNESITDKLLLDLTHFKDQGNIVPFPVLTVVKEILKGAEMAVISVWPAIAPPVRYQGQIWIRVGPRRAKASAQDETILNERRRYRDIPFDIHPLPSCPLGELSRVMFEEEYLPNAFAPEVIQENGRTFEQQLASCRMIPSVSEPTPTVLGLLAIGKSSRSWLPCDYIQFLRIRGTEFGDPIVDEEVIEGTLAQMLRRLDDKLKAHLTTRVDFTSGSTEKRTSPYPLVALQQLARNAIMHRTYEKTHAPIRVYWFDNRIEIYSPGGPYGLVNAKNFGQSGVTDYRNPHIAEAMKVLGYVQRFGMGIATAQKALKENGNPPIEFKVDESKVLITVKLLQSPLI